MTGSYRLTSAARTATTKPWERLETKVKKERCLGVAAVPLSAVAAIRQSLDRSSAHFGLGSGVVPLCSAPRKFHSAAGGHQRLLKEEWRLPKANSDDNPVPAREAAQAWKIKKKVMTALTAASVVAVPLLVYFCYARSSTQEEHSFASRDSFAVAQAKLSRLFSQIKGYSLRELLEKIWPLSSEPLLPDKEDLNYSYDVPTLVLGMDQVILKMEYDHINGWRVVKRPGADDFFKDIVWHYELVVWDTHAAPTAADIAVKWGLPVIGTIHREHCHIKGDRVVKDLSRLGRDLKRVIIVDHKSEHFSFQPDNGILIKPFDGDPSDNELHFLGEFLKHAATSGETDLRKTLKRYRSNDGLLTARWATEKAEKDKKAQARRNVSRLFGTREPALLKPNAAIS